MVAQEKLEKLANIFRCRIEQYITNDTLQRKLGVDHSEFSSLISLLRDGGFFLIYEESRGHKLLRSCDLINVDKIKTKLKTKYIGHDLEYLDLITSTQTLARKRLKEGYKHIVIVGNGQTEGRGQRRKNWLSAKGQGVWMSIGAHVNLPIQNIPIITLLTSIAVIETLLQFKIKASIKWPNDCLINNQKNTGILAESFNLNNNGLAVIIGVGMNVYQTNDDDFTGVVSNKPISLMQVNPEFGVMYTRGDVISELLNKIEELYFEYVLNGFLPLKEKWNEYAYGRGEKVMVKTNKGLFQGTLSGVNDRGELLLKDSLGGIMGFTTCKITFM